MDTALIAAGIAATAAVVAAVMSWIAAHQARRSNDRTHSWERITWAVRAQPGTPEYDISRSVLRRLHRLRWAPKDDRKLARALVQRTSPSLDDDHRPPGDEPW